MTRREGLWLALDPGCCWAADALLGLQALDTLHALTCLLRGAPSENMHHTGHMLKVGADERLRDCIAGFRDNGQCHVELLALPASTWEAAYDYETGGACAACSSQDTHYSSLEQCTRSSLLRP